MNQDGENSRENTYEWGESHGNELLLNSKKAHENR